MRATKTTIGAFLALMWLMPLTAWQVSSGRPASEQAVREIDREISLLFQQKKNRSSGNSLRITFTRDTAGKAILRKHSFRSELIVRDSPDWGEDPEIISALISVLLCEKSGVEIAILPMPQFLISGIQGYLRHLSNSGSVNRSNRYAPVTRALLRRGEALDLPVDLYASGKSSDPALLAWQEEFAQIFLRALSEYGILKNNLPQLLEDPRSWTMANLASLLPGDPEKILKESMEKFACHRYSEMPAQLAWARWKSVSSIPVPVVDENGEAAGDVQTVRITSLLPFIAERPDRDKIIRNAVQELKSFRMLIDSESSDPVKDLIFHLSEMDEAKVVSDSEKVERSLRNLAAKEAQIDSLVAHIPAIYPVVSLRMHLIRSGNNQLSPRGKMLLDEWEKIY